MPRPGPPSPKELRSQLLARIKRRRDAEGWSLNDFARHCRPFGVSRAAVHQLLGRQVMPNLKTFVLVARAVGVRVVLQTEDE